MRPLAATLLLTLPVPAAADWPSFRGPNLDGSVDADPPAAWSAGEAGESNLAWKAELPGVGSSTPVVVGDTVFVQLTVDTGQAGEPRETGGRPGPAFMLAPTPTTVHDFVVMAFDVNTGAEKWRTVVASAVPHEPGHKTNNFAPATPCSDGQRLYAFFGSFGVYALSLDGEVLWSRDFGPQVTRAQFGEGASPAVHGGTLVVPWDHEGDSRLYALDAATGETRWEVPREEATTWGTPLITQHEGRTQVVTNGGTVRSYDLADGSLIWSLGGMTGNPIPTPVRVGDSVVVMTGYKGYKIQSVKLSAEGDAAGSVNWTRDDAAPYVPSPSLAGGMLWFTKSNNGIVTALDAETGETVLKPTRLPGVEQIYSAPTAAGGKVYFTGRGGATTVLAADGVFNVLAMNEVGETVDASAVPVGRRILIRGTKHLFCFGE